MQIIETYDLPDIPDRESVQKAIEAIYWLYGREHLKVHFTQESENARYEVIKKWYRADNFEESVDCRNETMHEKYQHLRINLEVDILKRFGFIPKNWKCVVPE